MITCAATLVTVIGSSVSPVISDGQSTSLLPISCVETIHNGDLAAFKSPDGRQPIVKLIAGLPGQNMTVDKDYTVIIDGVPATRPDGEVWVLTPRESRLLKLFEGPLRGYLVVGNPGSLDSSKLGLLDIRNIIAISKPPYE